jgi:hypothetical protein
MIAPKLAPDTDPADPGGEALEAHCRRFVETNYHPSGAAGSARAMIRKPSSIRACGCAE